MVLVALEVCVHSHPLMSVQSSLCKVGSNLLCFLGRRWRVGISDYHSIACSS